VIVEAARLVAITVLLVLVAYTVRHLVFAVYRLFSKPRMDYTDLAGFHLPSVSILIPSH
jgi:hypothetical protein